MVKTGRVLDRLCTLCAVFFCAVIAVQNVFFTASRGQWVSLLALILTAAAAFLAVKILPDGRYVPVVLFVLRFAAAMLVIWTVKSQPVQDFQTIYTAACQMAQGSREYLALESRYFYNWAYQTAFAAYESFVIRLFGEGYLAIQVLNALYLAGTNVLVYLIGRRLLPGKGGLAAGVLYLLYPAPLFLAAVLTNQHLSTFLLYLGVLVLLGRRDRPLTIPRAVLGGVLLALGNAMWPVGVIVLLAGVLWCAVSLLRHFRRSLRWVLSALARPAVLAVTYVLAGALLSAAVVWSGANPAGLTNNQPMWKFVLGFNEESSGAWNEEDYTSLYLLQGEEADAAMRQVVRERLSVGPVRLARLMLAKSYLMWADNEDLYWGFGHLKSDAPLIGSVTAGQAVNLMTQWDKGAYLLIFALALLWLGRRLANRDPDGDPLLPVLIFCGYYAVYLIIEVQARYRYSLVPAAVLFAGGALAALAERRKPRPPES